MSFHAGQRLQCIRGNWKNQHLAEASGPSRGAIVTVACVGLPPPCLDQENREWISLVEWPPLDYFVAENFRPITKKKTDISVFTKILDCVNGRQKEPTSVMATNDQQSVSSPEPT